MRVVAGSAKGHHLRAPRGMDTRPTSDKVREAIFSILGARFVDEDVLDLYAGTGALGIEALSRGAATATFVEKRRPACETIRDNLRHTRTEEQARLLCMPVERALAVIQQTFGVILLDPPYSDPHLPDIMPLVSGAGVMRSATIVVFEHSPRFVPDERYGRLSLRQKKVYGDTAVSFFEIREEQP